MNLASEQPLRLHDAAKFLGVGLSTVRTWASRGSSGVILETIKIGGVRITTKEALERFAGCGRSDDSTHGTGFDMDAVMKRIAASHR